MILSTHALSGAVIGKNLESPLLIIFLSLGLHFILDSFRHGEYFDSRTANLKNSAWKVFLDLSIAGTILLAFLFWEKPNANLARNIFLGSFFSMLPDFLTLLFWKFNGKILGTIKKFHEFSHRYEKFPRFSPERQWTFRNARNDLLILILATILLFL